MLVLMSHTSEDLSRIVSSQTSVVLDKSAARSSRISMENARDRQDVTPSDRCSREDIQRQVLYTNTHQRPPSGLFDIIYDQTPTKPRLISSDINSEQLKSPSYIEIEKAILAGHAFAGDNSPHSAPTVTMIDDTMLRRGGSVVSKDASLRHRNTVKRRIKMARRLPERCMALSSLVFSAETESKRATKKSTKNRIFSIFPVKRRTSYKYYPAPKIEAKPRFTSQRDVDSYFFLNKVTSLMKDILPSTMNAFEFRKLQRMNPVLETRPARFQISRDAQFTEIELELSPRPITRVDSPIAQFLDSLNRQITVPNSNLESLFVEDDPDFIKRKAYLKDVYTNFRRIAFAGKRSIPLKLETVLPNESDMLTVSERESLNVQILLEVLLRRTLAAKIKFRLDQSGHGGSVNSIPYSTSSVLSSSSLSEHSDGLKVNRSKLIRFHSNPRREHVSAVSPDWSKLDSDDEQDSSVSEHLPSPQITFASNGFEYIPSNLNYSTRNNGELGQMAAYGIRQDHTKNRGLTYASEKTPSNKSMHDAFEQKLTKYDAFSSSSKYSSQKLSRTDSMSEFPNGLGQSFLASDDQSLGNVDPVLLRPLNRSSETLSTTSHIDFGPRDNSYIQQPVDAENSWSYSLFTSGSERCHRMSGSTVNTSVSREIYVVDDNQEIIHADVSEAVSPIIVLEFSSLRSLTSGGEKTETPETVTMGIVRDELDTRSQVLRSHVIQV
ncbi:hypothetical protein METSCH_B02820 [Metschnikowia aff. pulcherrima]|uniref:Uncharacterized protein n=1 Tax=Metschnikowia aff. pulcherrima TaxID=2163413 RepID=A0A4V1ADW0_9ASCO|nr:hypothetical protein METSCH_B02820 [Metschnikowia aff. pulcherrima]